MTKKLVARAHKWYGWVPDLPDQRDRFLTVEAPVPLPPAVDLRPGCPAVYDQGNLGSCTANAIGAALEFDQAKQGQPDVFVPSRLFIYYNERVLEGTIREDAGAMIRDGVKSVAAVGAPHEKLWPYVIASFARKPSAAAVKDAKKHHPILYERVVQTADQIRGVLASGFPVIFGFSVYESFESDEVAASGVVPMPGADERVLGGHAVLCVGYDDATGRFLVRNSWGAAWGQAGHFTIPYAYLTDENLADDFWVVRLIT